MAVSSLREIALAWVRSFNPTNEQQALASQRLQACEACRHHVEAPGASVFTHLRLCGLCGCPLIKKIYSPDGPGACPAGRWTA